MTIIKKGKSKSPKRLWALTEVNLLIELWLLGASIPEIARNLRRNQPTVRAKVSNLRRQSPELGKKLKCRTLYKRRLTAAMIPKIRQDKRTLRLIGEQYGVSGVTIHKIKTGALWGNVK